MRAWLYVPLTEHIKTHLTYFREKQDACGDVYTGLKTQHQLYVGLWAFSRRAGLVIRIENSIFQQQYSSKDHAFCASGREEIICFGNDPIHQ